MGRRSGEKSLAKEFSPDVKCLSSIMLIDQASERILPEPTRSTGDSAQHTGEEVEHRKRTK